jgi:hypothetical protein
MIDNIVALGYGIIVFAVVIGVGSLVIFNFSGATANCAVGYSWNATQAKCVNATYGDPTAGSGAAYTNTQYMLTQLGSTGLAGWVPAIIAVSVGLLFLGGFMIGNKGSKRY